MKIAKHQLLVYSHYLKSLYMKMGFALKHNLQILQNLPIFGFPLV
jgi:hypothetical protein